MFEVWLNYIGERRLRRASGNSSSIYITIPSEIVKELKLKPGDRMLIYLTDDGRIVLSPEKHREIWHKK